MASVVAKCPTCGGNGTRKSDGEAGTTYGCLRCGGRFVVPKLAPIGSMIAELVGASSSKISHEAIDCGYEPRGIADSWTQEYEAIVRVTDAAVLFRLERDREVWVPKSVLIAVGSRAFECATWFARKEIDV